MNLYLHQVEPHIMLGDSIYDTPGSRRYNVVLTNPPFGTRGANQAPARDDFVVATSNKQLNLIQHVITILKRGGRAAIVVPDNVLFANQAADVFKILMEDCDVHTVLRCPRGSFSPYTEGTKTNVIFFTKGRPTETVWIYDARANIPKVTKRSRPLSSTHFDEFERCYGNDPNGQSSRSESDSPEGRWRAFRIDEVRQRRYKLDSFRWIRDLESNDPEDLPEPEEAITAALGTLQQATSDLADIQRLIDEMSAPSPDSGAAELITQVLERQDVRRAVSGPRLSDAIRAIEQFRQSIIGAACSGRLTADWRDEHDDDTTALLRALKQQSRKRRKPLAKPQLDIEFPIPDTWQVVTLDLLIDRIEAGKSFNALGRPATADEWGVIKVSAMSWGNFREDENKAVPEGWEINPRYEIRSQDLLLSRANTEDLVGATILVRETRPGLLLSDKSLRLVPYEGIDRTWLNYTLRSPLVRSQFSELATGTSDSMRNLSQDKVRSVTLCLPPTNEQIEIGRRLSALLSMADALVVREGW